jgi:hypothetical protein
VSVERAMQVFVDMLDSDQDYLPAVLGMATGFMIEKNQVSPLSPPPPLRLSLAGLFTAQSSQPIEASR